MGGRQYHLGSNKEIKSLHIPAVLWVDHLWPFMSYRWKIKPKTCAVISAQSPQPYIFLTWLLHRPVHGYRECNDAPWATPPTSFLWSLWLLRFWWWIAVLLSWVSLASGPIILRSASEPSSVTASPSISRSPAEETRAELLTRLVPSLQTIP